MSAAGTQVAGDGGVMTQHYLVGDPSLLGADLHEFGVCAGLLDEE